MKCLIGDSVSVDILKDDVTCVDIIEQKLSIVGREVGSCSISTFYIFASSTLDIWAGSVVILMHGFFASRTLMMPSTL